MINGRILFLFFTFLYTMKRIIFPLRALEDVANELLESFAAVGPSACLASLVLSASLAGQLMWPPSSSLARFVCLVHPASSFCLRLCNPLGHPICPRNMSLKNKI